MPEQGELKPMFEVLVLGATGFIGGHVAKAAENVGWQVRGFRRHPTRVGHLSSPNVSWFEGNLKDINSLQKAMRGVDLVFHAAAYYPQTKKCQSVTEHIRVAREETDNVLHAAQTANIRRLIYTSSLSTIGKPSPEKDRLADERDVYQPGTLPGNAYYEVKSVMEQAVLEAAGEGLSAVIVNPTLVFGPGDVHLASGQVFLAAAKGKVIVSPPGIINVIDVRDVAASQIAAARNGNQGERYILGGYNYPISEIIALIAQSAGKRPPLFTIPPWTIRMLIKLDQALPFLPDLPDHLRAFDHWGGYNTHKAKEELNLTPRLFEETVRDSLKWYQDQGLL
jgi:dihydroflavonol-4-reductase